MAQEPPTQWPTVGASPDTGAKANPGVVETHVSMLFFVRDRVYKLRKAVKFAFLDFTRVENRRLDCEREVALNLRLAPDVYLGVADLQLNGEVIDHMVVMRRMPADRCLAVLARHGDDLRDPLHDVARTMAEFHRDALRSDAISEAATQPSLRAGWAANFEETESFVGTVLDGDVECEVRALVEEWIAGRAALLDARVASGRICDGHGDLRADDIFCLPDGARILDCVEFSDELRYGDVCADVGFLAMDLERLSRPEAAAEFLLDYQDQAGDRFPDSLVHHYCASRAYVRAKVACLCSDQGAEDALAEARQLHLLCLEHLRRGRVRLILVGGLPGTGKSTIAQGLAERRGWTVLRTDVVRQEMVPGESEHSHEYQSGRYRPEDTAAVYRGMLESAADLLRHGQTVVLDASWVDAGMRQAAHEVAGRVHCPLFAVCCRADASVARARVADRLIEGADVSEATPEVASAMARGMDPWPQSMVIDTTGESPTESIDRVLVGLVAADTAVGPQESNGTAVGDLRPYRASGRHRPIG